MTILSLAIPTPLRRSFDYLPPADMDDAALGKLQPGMRVRAPFGNRVLVGILLEIKQSSDLATDQLKPVEAIIDQQPTLTAEILALLRWAASYYQYPLGDAISNAIPAKLRKGETLIELKETCWQLSTQGKGLPEGGLKRAKQQAKLLELLQNNEYVNASMLNDADIKRTTIKALQEKGLIDTVLIEAAATTSQASRKEEPPPLNTEQLAAVSAVNSFSQFQSFLLDGITGSGKTEVYLQLIEKCLQENKQALILIPEIGLTPQTLARFERRFGCPIAVLHSGLSDRERLIAWQQARNGYAKIIIGTRSAVFTPTESLGLIIIDEEHDSSFKQQDGFRYSARDLGIYRAAQKKCPIVLGSATPSLETLNNALTNKYRHLRLSERATGALLPEFQLVDVRNAAMDEGFSQTLIASIRAEINNGNQVLVFINRRGFAPVMMCHDCGYVAQCHQCDSRMTVHFQNRLLRCHHCESQTALPRQCPACNSQQLTFRGSGTERSEQALNKIFPSTRVIRIDRDTTARKHAMQAMVDDVHTGEPCILVGTQMLAKGHHFSDVTLVAVLDADGGLFSADFRGPEKMGQLLVQVAGRAGRDKKPGKVMIQTHQPDHPLISSLVSDSYQHYAKQLLDERRSSGLPPFGYLAMIRAEARHIELPDTFLSQLRHRLDQEHNSVTFLGPLPAPMARRAGFHRSQLVMKADQRKDLHKVLQQLVSLGDQHPLSKKLRWSVDVDPSDIF